MGKYRRKVNQAVEARRKSWDSLNANERAGTQRPGSQNRKKGYGKRGGRR